MKAVLGWRKGCPSYRHDTVYSRTHYHCACPLSLELYRERKRAWEQTEAGKAALKRKAEKAYQKRAEERIVREMLQDERYATVRSRTLAGESSAAIATRLRTTQRTVVRIRRRLRELGRLPQAS